MSNLLKVKLIGITFLLLISFSSCSRENASSTSDEINQITIFVDYDINEGTKEWLYSLKNQFPEYNLSFITNIVTNEKYFIESMMENNFEPDIIISKHVSKENNTNLANLAGKSFFPSSSFNALKKMDQNGNIYLIPFTDTKKYLLINKSFFKNNNLSIPTSAKDLLTFIPKLKNYPNSVYINYNSDNSIANALFNYAFSLTDGLTIKGFKWAEDLEDGVVDVTSFDLSKTFDFMDYFKGIELHQIDSQNEKFSEALERFKNGEIAIFELTTNDIEQIEPYFTSDMFAIPYYSTLDKKNYVISENQIYVGVNKTSMENKKEILDTVLSTILGEEGDKEVILDKNSIYTPLIGLSTSVYDTFYESADTYEKNQIVELHNFERGKDYLTTAVEQYLLGEIDREEFKNYWQQDVLVSRFELNKVALANTQNDLTPRECSMIIAKSIYDEVDCDISVVTVSSLMEDLTKLESMYSSSPYYIKEGDIYWEDIYNIIPPNQNVELSSSTNQKILYSIFSGEQLINFLNTYSNKIVYYGVKKINDDYYIIKKDGSVEQVLLDGYYNFITNSNFYIDGFSLPNPILYNKTVIDCLNKWIIENNNISTQSIFTYSIIAK